MIGSRRALTLMVAGLMAFSAVACTGDAPVNRSAPASPLVTRVGATNPGERVSFSLVLRPRHERALQRFLAGINDPSSPNFGRYLDAAEFGRRFGVDGATLRDARAFLQEQGFTVLDVFPQRTSLELAGTAQQIRDTFGVRLVDFLDPDGRPFHQPASPAVVPTGLRDAVSGVAGLNTVPIRTEPADIPSTGLKPIDVARAYNIQPLHDRGIQGQGQNIAIVSLASFRQQDVDQFMNDVGIDAEPVEHVSVNGGNEETTSSGSGEVNLDIDVILGVAPKAHLINYEGPNVGGGAAFTSIFNQIVADGRVKIASVSWGSCDVPRFSDGSLGLDPADRTATKRVLEAAVAQGISFFVASHDSGAYMCQLQLPTDTRPTLSWPSDDPNVVSVGGTRLSVRQDGSYLSEQGWEDILSQSGTGGGVNPEDPLPDYQTDVYQADQNPQRLRQTPDVAASADPDSGFYVVSPNPQTEASEAGQVGGTSASTPFWAAAMLLVQQFAEQRGAGALGFVNPMLYAIAADPTAGSEPFHDVLRGGNRLHVCGPGWDFATGLGSPDVTALAQNVVDYLKRTNPNG